MQLNEPILRHVPVKQTSYSVNHVAIGELMQTIVQYNM
jgi:hypothetical protein